MLRQDVLLDIGLQFNHPYHDTLTDGSNEGLGTQNRLMRPLSFSDRIHLPCGMLVVFVPMLLRPSLPSCVEIPVLASLIRCQPQSCHTAPSLDDDIAKLYTFHRVSATRFLVLPSIRYHALVRETLDKHYKPHRAIDFLSTSIVHTRVISSSFADSVPCPFACCGEVGSRITITSSCGRFENLCKWIGCPCW